MEIQFTQRPVVVNVAGRWGELLRAVAETAKSGEAVTATIPEDVIRSARNVVACSTQLRRLGKVRTSIAGNKLVAWIETTKRSKRKRVKGEAHV